MCDVLLSKYRYEEINYNRLLEVRQGFPIENISSFRKPTFKPTLSMPTLTFQLPGIFISTEFIEKRRKNEGVWQKLCIQKSCYFSAGTWE